MTKGSDRREDSEVGSVAPEYNPSKIGAIIFPTFCALVLVCIFVSAYLGTRIGWDRYEAYCNRRRYDFTKMYVFPQDNLTVIVKPY